MLYYLVSTDPNNYGTIQFKTSIASINSTVMYRIQSLSSIASFSMTTPDDYMIIETTIGDEPIELTLHFQEHGAYDLRMLAYELNNLFEGQLVPVDEELPINLQITLDSTNRLVMTANKEFSIKAATHRVKLLFGLYHSTLPINSIQKQILMPSVPYVSYGNCLYLTARTDFVSFVNTDKDKEIAKSIAYKTNELLYNGYPIICRMPGNWSFIQADQLCSLEFQLVDFQLVPVVLHAPLFITLELERVNGINHLPESLSPNMFD